MAYKLRLFKSTSQRKKIQYCNNVIILWNYVCQFGGW